MSANSNLTEYYAQRAAEYERVYQKPERQQDLAALRQRLLEELAGEEVLEAACGTGYWTQVIAQTAKSILATDINEEVLQIARAKDYLGKDIVFENHDAFQLSALRGPFTAGLAAFWWSHLKTSEIKPFLQQFHRAPSPDAKIVFLDNKYVSGSSTPISQKDEEGNTYQFRRLDNGTEYKVLKNFPDKSELQQAINGFAKNIRFFDLTYYWMLSYRKAQA